MSRKKIDNDGIKMFISFDLYKIFELIDMNAPLKYISEMDNYSEELIVKIKPRMS